MRLDAYLRQSGAASRREVRSLVAAGRITVDGITAQDYAADCLPGQTICLDGTPVLRREAAYFMLHKPAGYITATQSSTQPTVLDLLPEPGGLFPVGRLDKDSEGLLLLTTDGMFCRQVIRPEKGVWKTYYIKVRGPFAPDTVQRFEAGMILPNGTRLRPAQIEISGDTAMVRIQEGITHQVRRMAAAVGAPVLYLKRLAIGALELDDSLLPGQFRPLTADERMAVFQSPAALADGWRSIHRE